MTEYIKREDALSKLYHDGEWVCNARGTYEAIEAIPKEDVTQAAHGTWEKDRDFIKCSACGYGMYPNYCRFMNGVCAGVGYNEPNYCPNCGAKMEGEHND